MNIPVYIQRRMYSLNKYAYDSLYPEGVKALLFKGKSNDEIKVIAKKLIDISKECGYMCFVFSLKQLFLEGTRAASVAVDTFQELGIHEFNIGKKEFKERNDNVLEGQHLYEKMIETISNPELQEFIRSANYYSEIIDRYRDVSI